MPKPPLDCLSFSETNISDVSCNSPGTWTERCTAALLYELTGHEDLALSTHSSAGQGDVSLAQNTNGWNISGLSVSAVYGAALWSFLPRPGTKRTGTRTLEPARTDTLDTHR